MYNFFVLGLIPGTNIQITFQGWLDMIEAGIAIVGMIWLYRQHRPVRVSWPRQRQPLHANQLHLRVG